MPQRNKMEIPSKLPKSFSVTCEREEEMQHDISKLYDQLQQISFSLKVNEAKMNYVEAKMNGIDANMEAKMNCMDAKMEA